MSTEAGHRPSVETAMSAVLRAEQDALAQIAACENRANRILQEARQAVRAMVRHAQKRISRMHAGSSARTREMVAALEREVTAETDRSRPNDADEERLRNAVSDVARELTERDATGGN